MKSIIQVFLNFFRKWHIHYASIIYLLLALLVHQLIYYLLAMLLVIIHEFCHYLMACYFHYHVEKIEILPFGAFLNINDIYTHSIICEACVILAGPCSHIFIYFVINLLPLSFYKNYLLSMNKLILLFNLLPIYPLDGGRLISLLLQAMMDLKTALYFHLKLSILSLCILSVFYFQYQALIVICYLYFQQILYYHYIPIFLRTSYLYMDNKQNKTIIHKQLKYRRDYNNYYLFNGQLYTSKQVLYALLENI
ncbi:MAG: hypothetical protein LUG12_03705 [Erysipelotrichaceae bacterium]|nr:hypothetical protein [Erysipelotrichaceae bacterium]